MSKLSVVVPVFNEVATVSQVVDRIRAADRCGLDLEIVLVDDGSSDGSTAEVERLGRSSDTVAILQPKNRGKGAALRTGFAAATGDYVVVQDADLEYDPAEYPRLLGPLIAGRADVVYGSRYANAVERPVPRFWHTLANRGLTTLSNALSDLALTDMETCYKAFRREVLATITIEEDRFGVEPELTAKIARGRWRVVEVGVSYEGRSYAEGKKIGVKDGVRALWCIAKYNLRR